MEKFSLFPSFASQNTFSSPVKEGDLSTKVQTSPSNNGGEFIQKAPDFTQKEAFLSSLLNDDDAEIKELPPAPKKENEGSENKNPTIFHSPSAMLNILSLHEQKANKIKGK